MAGMLLSLTPVALLVLHAQRHLLPDEHMAPAAWRHHVNAARDAGQLVILVQWDGPPGTPGETFTRGWTLHPDLRVEAGELALRAARPDAFRGTDLDAQLRAHAVRELHLLAWPEPPEREATAATARSLGYAVTFLPALP